LSDSIFLYLKMKKRNLELYLHIPFCVRKCNYCDFFSASGTPKEQADYVSAMIQEIQSYQELSGEYEVQTIFLGGGTPSLLTPEQIEKIFTTIYHIFSVNENAEITMEMNPGTVAIEKLRAMKAAGVNRLSIGLQSAQNEELKMLGRIHTYEEFLETWRLTEQAGFKNRNIDLMSALPGQTMESYEDTLSKVLALEPEHISAYSLILEEGTVFYDWYEKGKLDRGAWKLPSEEEEYAMGELTIQRLAEAGMHRYEISNYAKPGKECRHNLGYWDRVEYLGIGAGSSSLIKGERFDHIRDRKAYIEKIRNGEPILIDREILSVESQMEEFMYLGLRKIEGVSRTDFQNYFGKNVDDVYGEILDKLEEEQLLEFSGDRIRLTHRGMDVSNCVLAEFLF
jgi:oxygen-independent coproporphyrinogen-3 oxidase